MLTNKKNHKQALKATASLLLSLSWSFVMPLPLSFGAEDAPQHMKIDLDNPNDTISMSFDGALLKDVLLLFSQQSGLNFVASQEAESKKVTVYFENVSPQDALDSIITANGLTYTKKPGSDIYLVSPISKTGTEPLITKVVHLKYMRLSGSPLDVGGGVTISDLQKSSAPSSSSSSSSSSSATTNSDKGADKLVTKLLTSQGKLAQDTQTNSLIITDTVANMEAIVKVLEELDVPPSQVILEVHVMEIGKTLASDLGIDWGGTDGAVASFASGIRTTGFPFTENFLNKQQGVKPSLFQGTITPTVTSTTLPTPSQFQYGTINATNFKATLHYIESDAKTRILARPRVLTQNNEAAAIKVVTNQAIGRTTSTTTTAGSNTTDTGIADRAEVGVTMRMTPQINNDDSVLLFLEPAVTTAIDSTLFPGIFRDTTTRLVRTMARIKDNQTLVIGGLIDGNESIVKRKVPFLGNLPGALGYAFRYDAVDNTDRELLIFVTPHIVRGASSLGSHSATARGEDVSLRRSLNNFMDKEMDPTVDTFRDYEKTKQAFFAEDQQLIRDTEKRLSNPLVDKQMTQALDTVGPQLIDTQMNQALDTLSVKKYHSS